LASRSRMEPFQATAGLFDVFDLFDVYGRPAITAIRTPKGLGGAVLNTLSGIRGCEIRLWLCYRVLSLRRPGIGRRLPCEAGELHSGRELGENLVETAAAWMKFWMKGPAPSHVVADSPD
jgi:hypothetical protein